MDGDVVANIREEVRRQMEEIRAQERRDIMREVQERIDRERE